MRVKRSYRIYSEDFGRFLSPDPLFEQFDSWAPYHFAFNNPVTYSDPSGLAPKKEKREAKLLEAPEKWADLERNLAMMAQIEEDKRVWAEFMSFMNYNSDAFNRWQDKLHPKSGGGGGNGGGGSSNNSSFNGNGMLLIYGDEAREEQKNKNNQNNGIIEGKERGTGKGDIPYPYSNEFVDNYNDGLKTYTTQEVMVYGDRPKTSFNDDVSFTPLENGRIIDNSFEAFSLIWGVASITKGIAKASLKGLGFGIKSSGIEFSEHALKRMAERNFKEVDVLRIIQKGHPIHAAGRYGSQIRYTLNGNTVIINSNGRLVTVFSNGKNGMLIPFK